MAVKETNTYPHASIKEMSKVLEKRGIPTVMERYKSQEPQCEFGLQGICCQLCGHGPCRITKKAQTGICGANADTIVARNWLRLASHGASAYSHHLESVCKTLKAAAQRQGPFKIKEEAKLISFAHALGLESTTDIYRLATCLADVLLSELRKGSDEPSSMVTAMAPKPRVETWKKLGLIPGGINSEIRDCLARTATSIDTDPVDLLLKSLRLSIAGNYTCLATEMVQDILFGTPQVNIIDADIGILDRDYVNIVAHGHEPLMAMAVIEAASRAVLKEKAVSIGAKGIRVYGSMDTGQELAQRSAHFPPGIYAGQLGNWVAQDFWLATGAIDLVMLDMNCSNPSMQPIASSFKTKLVPVSNIVCMGGAEKPIPFEPQRAMEQATELIDQAIDAFKSRRTSQEVFIPSQKGKAVVGTAVESVLKVLGNSLDPLLDAIKNGSIKGIAAVVGCSTCKTGFDQFTINLSKELIKRDILVVNSGCASSATEIEGLLMPEGAELAGSKLRGVCKALGIPPCLSFGTCTDISRIIEVVSAVANALGVDVPALPVAASAPEYLEQKAVLYGSFAVAYGLFLHVAPLPHVTGSPLVTKILTQDAEALVGGKVCVELDPVKAAEQMENHILAKRKALGI